MEEHIPAFNTWDQNASIIILSLRLSGGTRESQRLLYRFFRETLFSNQLQDFSLLSWNSLLHPFLGSEFTKNNSFIPKNFFFEDLF